MSKWIHICSISCSWKIYSIFVSTVLIYMLATLDKFQKEHMLFFQHSNLSAVEKHEEHSMDESNGSNYVDNVLGNVSSPSDKPPLTYGCEDFVIFSDDFADGRGLGNQMFSLVAALMVAKLIGRRIAVNNSVKNLALEDVFDYKYERFSQSDCQKQTIYDLYNLGYNPTFEALEKDFLRDIAHKTIITSGFFQSWRYALDEQEIRHKYLVFQEKFKAGIEKFFQHIKPANWSLSTYIRVGVHVRRGDVLIAHFVEFGYTTPNASYFINAMLHFLKLFNRIQFIIVTNDIKWAQKNILADRLLSHNYTAENFNITFSPFLKNRGYDLAILAMGHHTIISTGTFGWWGGWLCRGTTIFYKDWPKPNSPLASKFIREDFFPPSWIGMSD